MFFFADSFRINITITIYMYDDVDKAYFEEVCNTQISQKI